MWSTKVIVCKICCCTIFTLIAIITRKKLKTIKTVGTTLGLECSADFSGILCIANKNNKKCEVLGWTGCGLGNKVFGTIFYKVYNWSFNDIYIFRWIFK